MTSAKRLAAIVFAADEPVDALIADFVAAEQNKGRRIAGVRQTDSGVDECTGAVRAVDIATGGSFALMQDLGRQAGSCRVDPSAIARVSQIVGAAVAGSPDLIVVNRFGKLEAEEKDGVVADIGAAVAAGVPVLVAVAARFLPAWNDFAAGLDAQLPCSRAALDAWWADLAQAHGS